MPATGFSIGVSRLTAALQLIGKLDAKPAPGPVVVTVFDQDRIGDYQQMVQALRAANIRAELYLGPGKFGAQMKYADKRGSPCVVIQGGDEKAKGEVQIKDLTLGAELAGLSKDRDEYRAEAGRGAVRREGERTGRRRAQGARPSQRDVGLISSGNGGATLALRSGERVPSAGGARRVRGNRENGALRQPLTRLSLAALDFATLSPP